MAVGFARPHLPFCTPKKYWDLYDQATLPRPESEVMPEGAPNFAGKKIMLEIGNYKPSNPKNLFQETYSRQLVHGYYASTSYMDAQIGKVIAALDESELAEDTIIVLWGGHGFHLSELGFWTKHVNYERANRIPIVIVAPGVTKPGSHTGQLTETVDLFPTLAELAGLPAPQVPKPTSAITPTIASQKAIASAGAIRTDRYRPIEWKTIGKTDEKAIYELYDCTNGEVEMKNIASENPEIVKELAAILATYPDTVR